jgi:hypothetical protein
MRYYVISAYFHKVLGTSYFFIYQVEFKFLIGAQFSGSNS